MKSLLVAVALLAVVGVILGFYLGWFNFSSKNGAGKTDVTLSVDKDKIEADKDKLVDKIPLTTKKAPE